MPELKLGVGRLVLVDDRLRCVPGASEVGGTDPVDAELGEFLAKRVCLFTASGGEGIVVRGIPRVHVTWRLVVEGLVYDWALSP